MGYTSLIFAAQGGHLETVQLLLKKEADVQAVSKARCARKRAHKLAVLFDSDTRHGLASTFTRFKSPWSAAQPY